MSQRCLRWAFNISQWEPSSSAEWLQVIQSIQPEEWIKSKQYLYKNDVKSSVVGRLMLRKAARFLLPFRHPKLPSDWKDIAFDRTDKGKPYLTAPSNADYMKLDLNISHHGDYVVLASSCGQQMGVDVMRIEKPRAKSVDHYLALMSKQFSHQEYQCMQSKYTEDDKIAAFYRFWCLKESYIKALGIGIHNNLSSLNFCTGDSRLSANKIEVDTVLMLDNSPNVEWIFEEQLLPNNHIATVCRKKSTADCCSLCITNLGGKFETVEISSLVSGCQPLQLLNEDTEWKFYRSKLSK